MRVVEAVFTVRSVPRLYKDEQLACEMAIYGCWSFTTQLLMHCKLQTRPLVREGVLKEERQSNCLYSKERKNQVMGPKVEPDTKTTG
jgi:hypothetical protein